MHGSWYRKTNTLYTVISPSPCDVLSQFAIKILNFSFNYKVKGEAGDEVAITCGTLYDEGSQRTS